MATAADLIIYGIVAHLVADWFFQNKNMSDNKMWLSRSFAGWQHGIIHILFAWLVFPYWWAVVIGILHIIIDTRVPLRLWRQFYRQSTNPTEPAFIAFAMWQDQVAHILVIALVAFAVGVA